MRIIPLLLLLTCIGCATASSVRSENRMNLLNLRAGMDREQVLEVMGVGERKTYDSRTTWGAGETLSNPYRTEMYTAGGHHWEILYYYTDIKADDGAISDDELTPLILKDGVLDGWGWTYWQDVAQRYDITIRRR